MERKARIEVGRRLTEIRGEKSQEEFAKWLGPSVVHKNTLARYERGERDLSMKFMLALNMLLGVNPAWVILGPEEGGPKFVKDVVWKGEPVAGYKRVAPLDHDAMRDVIQVVEEFLQERGLVLEPAKKAELLVLIYEDVREHEGKVDRARVIRLVKLAA